MLTRSVSFRVKMFSEGHALVWNEMFNGHVDVDPSFIYTARIKSGPISPDSNFYDELSSPISGIRERARSEVRLVVLEGSRWTT